MNSKTTLWGQIGAAGTAISGLSFIGSSLSDDLMAKKILAWVVFIGFAVSAVAKSVAGVAAADAFPGEKKIESDRVDAAKQ